MEKGLKKKTPLEIKRLVVLGPSGSGKTKMIEMIFPWYLFDHTKSILWVSRRDEGAYLKRIRIDHVVTDPTKLLDSEPVAASQEMFLTCVETDLNQGDLVDVHEAMWQHVIHKLKPDLLVIDGLRGFGKLRYGREEFKNLFKFYQGDFIISAEYKAEVELLCPQESITDWVETSPSREAVFLKRAS